MANFDILDTLSDEEYFNAMPSGYRFAPSNVQLVYDYLRKYLHDQQMPRNRINRGNVYDYSPDTLTGLPHVQVEEDEKNNQSWYFFTPRFRKYGGGKRPGRAAGYGFWKPSTKKTEIVRAGRLIGHVTSLVYYIGTHEKNEKTNWLMQEYTLKNPPAPVRKKTREREMDHALCKLYVNQNNYTNKSKSRSPKRNSRQQIVHVEQQQPIVNPRHDEYMKNESAGPIQGIQQQLQVYQEPGGPSTLQQDDQYMMNETRGSNEDIPTQGFNQQYHQVNEEPGSCISHEDQPGTASNDNLLPGYLDFLAEDLFQELAKISPCSNQQYYFNLHETSLNDIPMQNPTTSNPMTIESDQQRDAFRPSDNVQNNSPMQNPMTFGSYQQRDAFNLSYNFPDNVPVQNPILSNPLTIGSIQQSDVFCPSDYSPDSVLMQNPAEHNQQRDSFCLSDNFWDNAQVRNPADRNQQRDTFCPSDQFQNNISMRNPAESKQQRDISKRKPSKSASLLKRRGRPAMLTSQS